MKGILKNTGIFLFGAIGYGLCEIIFRGYTHPSMLVAGGVCFCRICHTEKKYFSLSRYLRSFSSAVFITSIELIFGCVFNLILKQSVWDYSDLPFNFMGQICLRFFVIWFALCLFISRIYEFTSSKIKQI